MIGAFIIAVIQNGMNLMLVESYTQKVVFGVVILAAVVVDMIKKRGWLNFLLNGQTQSRSNSLSDPHAISTDS